MEVNLLSWANYIKYSIQYSLWPTHYSCDDVLTGFQRTELVKICGWDCRECMTILSIQIIWWSVECTPICCQALPWRNNIAEIFAMKRTQWRENSDFLVFNIVVRVYCCTRRQEVHKCNTGLILWLFLLATTIKFFIDSILSVAVWILVQMMVPFFILSDNWQQEAITSYIMLVEKISGECSPYSFIRTFQHLGHPTNIDLRAA